MPRLMKYTALAMLFVIGSSSAFASGGVAEQRRNYMETIGKSIGISFKMVRGQLPYNAAKAAEAMRAVTTASGQFVKLSANAKNAQDLTAKCNELKNTSARASAAAMQGKGAFGAAFRAVRKSYGNCYASYTQK